MLVEVGEHTGTEPVGYADPRPVEIVDERHEILLRHCARHLARWLQSVALIRQPAHRRVAEMRDDITHAPPHGHCWLIPILDPESAEHPHDLAAKRTK